MNRRRFLAGGLAAGAGLGFLGVQRFRVLDVSEPLHVVQAVAVLGTRLSLVVRHPERREASAAIRSAVRRVFDVHHSMTLQAPSDLTSLNENAGGVGLPVPVMEVIDASRRLHVATEGLFDPTVGPVLKRIARISEQHNRLPTDANLALLRHAIGMERIAVDVGNRSVVLPDPGMALDLNGIAKGYAVDCAVAELRAAGFAHFLVNAGGDLYAAGSPDEGRDGWRIQLASPDPAATPVHSFVLSDEAAATSGNTQQPSLPGGPIPHLVHPIQGMVFPQYASVTALAPSAMEADAFATALFVGQSGESQRVLAESPQVTGWAVSERGRVARL